ncbi:MAG: 16S rRNA (cytosine(1402)-N(4))-methyltransferase RsmH [Bacteroidales bacterium]|nr:16S rRNA (cytosine(1402)-N(4))-methyltransferase RsmH [Bacteroidales bacterium]
MVNYHIPALLQESISGLNIKPDGVYVDVTFGGGGHSREILKPLNTGKLIAFDQDKDAFKNTIEDNNFMLIHSNYRYIKNFLRFYGFNKVDGILADLGISFHQVDDASRGFSFKSDAAIDMRMNNIAEKTAADILNEYSEKELLKVFKEYGELKNAWQITKKIIENRKQQPFKRINQLISAIENMAPKKFENKFYAKVFQALRIEVNGEMEALKEFLESTTKLLNPNGRLVIISYHSLEDRIVKNFIRSGNVNGTIEKDVYGNFETPFKQINKKIIIPSEAEVNENPRSRSAKLRIAEKI